MASNDRFYQVSLDSRPAYWGDLGHRLQLSGFLLAGEGKTALVLSPNMEMIGEVDHIIQPTVAEWCEMIAETDDPKVFEMDETGVIKATHRKMRYAISGDVQQKIWARDGFKCMYCGREMGEVQLSVDHFDPLEFGGAETQENLISACRKCNKRKGSISARDWCDKNGLLYDDLKRYLANTKIAVK